MLDYTQYEGNRCTLPLLGDAYGLYYNKDAFAAAGITAPPKTLSEFDADAVKLTKSNGDSYSQLGFMPNYHGYETTTTHYAAKWGPTYFDADGKSTVATDPAFAEMFEWQKQLVDKLGGYDKLEKYRTTFGDEWGAKNPFQTGQVAMALDGEWRAGFIEDADVDFDCGVAPFPVPDDQADTYGKGYLSGTIIGIASTSEKQNAAWEFVKYLTTDTEAVVELRQRDPQRAVDAGRARVARPRPETRRPRPSSGSPQNPDSNTTPASPNGGAYQLTLQDLGYDVRVRQGRPTCRRASRSRRPDRHGHRPGRVSSTAGDGASRTARRPPASNRSRAQAPPRHPAQPRVPVAVAARHRSVLPLSAGLDRLLLLHALRRVHAADVDRARQLAVRLPRLPVLLAGPAQHAVAGGRDGRRCG